MLDLEAQARSMDDIDDDDDEDEEEGEDDQDMRDPTPEPDELDEDIVESDLELDHDGVVHPDHDDAPQKVLPLLTPISVTLFPSLLRSAMLV